MFILNPNFETMIAALGAQYHLTYNLIDDASRYCIIRTRDVSDLEDKYQNLKNVIESFDPDVGFTSNGVTINTFEDFYGYIANQFDYVDTVFEENYLSKDLGKDNYDHKYVISVFAIFENDYKIYDGTNIIDKRNLKCSLYETTNIHLHKEEPLLAGHTETNNKLSRWDWDTKPYDDFDDITFDVSIWRDDKLINVYNTEHNYFIFAESISDILDGNYELVVNAVDPYGSVSFPTSFTFLIRTNIINDLKLEILSSDGTPAQSINNTLPTFKLYNFDSDYDYKFVFNNDPDQTYLYSEEAANAVYDAIDNSITLVVSNELPFGFNSLSVQKIDKMGNRIGSTGLAKVGIYGSSFISFNIVRNLVPTSELVGYQWLNAHSVMLSWKNTDTVRDFMVYQGNELIKQTRDAYIVFDPLLVTDKDTIISIFAYDYLGNRSLNPLTVKVYDIITTINELVIDSPDTIIVDNQVYINNSNPSFIWTSKDVESDDVVAYKISLDGSHWKTITVNYFTYLNSLHDGIYTFRVIPVYSKNREGKQFTYDFVLNTLIPSAPVFDTNTRDLNPDIQDNLIISWLNILNIVNYEYVINEPFIDTNTKFNIINTNFLHLSDLDTLPFGLNTISLRSIDNFGNRSRISKFTFLVLSEKVEEQTSEEFESRLNFNVKDTLSNNNEFYDFDISDSVLDSVKIINTLTDPYNKILENSVLNITGSVFTNKIGFLINGFYNLNTKWYDSDDVLLKEKNQSYLFNNKKTIISSINYLNKKITWDVVDINKNDYVFKYSISEGSQEFHFYNEVYGYELDISNELVNGDYFINLKCYDRTTLILNDIKIFNFKIDNSIKNSIKKIPIQSQSNYFLNISSFPNSNSFKINNIVDYQDNIIEGFLEYKRVTNSTFTLYDDSFLNFDIDYNFIFNKVDIMEVNDG